MDEDKKCVIIIDCKLPLGLIANTAAILGITLGKIEPDIAGCDVRDKDGALHLGITEIPVPILKGETEDIKKIRQRLYYEEFSDLKTIDFSSLAQGCKTYEEFREKMGRARNGELEYLGILIFGNKKKVNKLTGSLPLLRG